MPHPRTILFVGGGSGGHIYPNLAVAERLPPEVATPHLVVSERPLDAQIAEDSGLAHTAIPAVPLSLRPRAGLRFLREYRRGRAAVTELIRKTNAVAMVATGGFVSGPAVTAAKAAGLPVALVSLDAVPGRANRFTARRATAVFSAFETHGGVRTLPAMEVIGFPLRRAAVARPEVSPAEARTHFGSDPEKKTLLVFAGSQGARTINGVMLRLADLWAEHAKRGLQILHVVGPGQDASLSLQQRYDGGGIPAKVLPFCHRMDLAWRAADVAVTRCGAGTVAEAWANAVPSVMLPYPFHKDEHQKHNAAPLVALGGAVVVKDRIDPVENAAALRGVLEPLFGDGPERDAMRRAMLDHPPPDGAQRLADWVRDRLGP
ncbi:MAG: glycosyltransferase [Planctomycetota bacterium]